MLGQEINTIINSFMAAWNHDFTWNAKDNTGKKVPSGIYFYKLHTPEKTLVKKMMLIK